jgi:hypothetical protein
VDRVVSAIAESLAGFARIVARAQSQGRNWKEEFGYNACRVVDNSLSERYKNGAIHAAGALLVPAP